MATSATSGANLGFESELWRAANALRSNMDAAEYKHIILGHASGSSIMWSLET
jgi:type I restriction enzyme M protein